MGLGPVHDLAKLRPVFHLLKGNLFHRRAGYDKSIKVFLPDIVQSHVKLIQVGSIRMGSGMAGHFHKSNLRLNREIRQHPQDIQLGVLLQRHEIQNRNPQRANLLCLGAGLIHHKYIFRLQYMLCRQIILYLNGHKFSSLAQPFGRNDCIIPHICSAA